MAREVIRKLVEIDEEHLDLECHKMPSIILEWSDALATAQADFNTSKNTLELVAANIEQWARNRPGKYGLPDEPTVSAIKSAVIRDKRYQDAHTAMVRAKYTLDLAKAAIKALARKSRELENLIELQMIGYRSDKMSRPNKPNTREIVEESRRRSMRKPLK